MAETALKPLTQDMLEVIGFIEHHWIRYGKFPTVGLMKERYPKFNLKTSLKHNTFRLALDNRGITIPTDVYLTALDNALEPEQELTNDQIQAASTYVNYTDTRSRTRKLQEMGISTTKWNGWLKNPTFRDFLHELSTRNFNDQLSTAHEGLLKAVDRGDTNAVKLYMEMTGRYTANSGQNQNIRVILARVIESIQRHIKDPNTLRAIATDFEVIMRGEVVNEVKEITI